MQKQKSVVIVYFDGGLDYKGEFDIKHIGHWLKLGRESKQQYMYKGWRFSSEYEDGKEVVVYDNKQWNEEEIKRRQDNGFNGITEYKLDDYSYVDQTD